MSNQEKILIKTMELLGESTELEAIKDCFSLLRLEKEEEMAFNILANGEKSFGEINKDEHIVQIRSEIKKILNKYNL